MSLQPVSYDKFDPTEAYAENQARFCTIVAVVVVVVVVGLYLTVVVRPHNNINNKKIYKAL